MESHHMILIRLNPIALFLAHFFLDWYKSLAIAIGHW